MSVSELNQRENFDRTPPQDVAAEQSVLGGMMLSKDAIADVVEVVRATDFYRPAHEAVYDAILDLYGRGEPADAVTVSAELTKRGEIARIGGAPYLHTLISSVPTAANAGFYARIVRERAVLRKLVDAGTRIVQLGYANDGGDVDELVNTAQAEVYAVTERRTSEDYLPLKDILNGTMEEIDAASHRGEGMIGVPTGFKDLDSLTNGLHPGQMIVVAARPAVGKALALGTRLPTPSGWTTMGQVQVGDQLLAADGTPTTVVEATDVLTDRACYEVVFDDGTVIVADAQHEWLTQTRASRKSTQAAEGYDADRNQRTFAEVRTTQALAATVRCASADARPNHSVRNAQPLELPEADLALDPYVLGVWLGDGHSSGARFASADPEVAMLVEGRGYAVDGRHRTAQTMLRTLGVLGDEHVPLAYLRASVRQRRALLAGLLDTAGTVSPSGAVQFTVTSERLALGVRELVHTLGYRTGWTARSVTARSELSATAYTLTFTTEDTVFALERKRVLHKERRHQVTPRRSSRFITEVRRVASVPVRCVEIEHPDHLYLASDAMIPTHNSTLGLDIVRSASIRHGMASVIFSLEMSRNEIAMRMLSAESQVPLQHLRKGTMRDDDWTRLARTMGKLSDAPMFIDDSPNMSLTEIRAKCRRLKQQHDLKIVVIDYLQLMSSGKRVESRQQEVSEFSRALKLLAKELDVPVIAISQLNRGSEQRTDKKPQMSDLRESGCLTADTKVLRADTGAEVSMGELFASGTTDVAVWALDERLKYVRRHLTHVFSTGVKPTFRLRLASGKEVTATANHPFLAYDGWVPLEQLGVGSRIGVPRHVPAPAQTEEGWDDRQVVMLAHLLGGGASVTRQPLPYASIDEANLAAVPAGAGACGRHEMVVPRAVFHLPKSQVSLFLRHLWASGGSVTINKDHRGGRIGYASTSRELIDGLSRLLLRFGISTRIGTVTKPGHGAGYTMDLPGLDDQRRFLQEIGVHGARGEIAARLLDVVLAMQANSNRDTVPAEVWGDVRQILSEKGITQREFAAPLGTQPHGATAHTRAPSRQRLGRIAQVLEDRDLEITAVNDLLWDEVVEITPLGEQEVFDATVVGTHNFIANGIAVHNSIEQDADLVVLLHREDMYEKESPRAGEADLIVAKHRNGPTNTIVVAFQGHYARFVDMPQ